MAQRHLDPCRICNTPKVPWSMHETAESFSCRAKYHQLMTQDYLTCTAHDVAVARTPPRPRFLKDLRQHLMVGSFTLSLNASRVALLPTVEKQVVTVYEAEMSSIEFYDVVAAALQTCTQRQHHIVPLHMNITHFQSNLIKPTDDAKASFDMFYTAISNNVPMQTSPVRLCSHRHVEYPVNKIIEPTGVLLHSRFPVNVFDATSMLDHFHLENLQCQAVDFEPDIIVKNDGDLRQVYFLPKHATDNMLRYYYQPNPEVSGTLSDFIPLSADDVDNLKRQASRETQLSEHTLICSDATKLIFRFHSNLLRRVPGATEDFYKQGVITVSFEGLFVVLK